MAPGLYHIIAMRAHNSTVVAAHLLQALQPPKYDPREEDWDKAIA